MTSPDPEFAAFARRLFGRATEDDPTPDSAPDPARGNHVPREGNNPPAGNPDDMHTLVKRLFERAHGE